MFKFCLSLFPFSESLDELTSMVVELFGEVENKNVPIPEFPEHPFQEEHLKVSEWLISVSNLFLHTSTLTMHSSQIPVINEMLCVFRFI